MNSRAFLKTVASFLILFTLISAIPFSAGALESAPDMPIPTIGESVLSYGASAAGVDTAAAPAYYSSVEKGIVTSPKNQGVYGTCWTFATVSAAETSVLLNKVKIDGVLPTVDTLDLSEAQIGYFGYKETPDALGTLAGDKNTYTGDWRYAGGNEIYTTLSLMAWKGLASEEDISYADAINGAEYSSADALASDVRLESAAWTSMSDITAVKKMIMEYGSVVTNYMHHDNFLVPSTGAYYCDTAYDTNHAITLVGWDDNYSASNFVTAPAGNGAWLIKNSWGENWGNGGYGWISYYDATLLPSNAAGFTFVEADKYDNNYQYDGSYTTSWFSLGEGYSMAVAYTAMSENSLFERIDTVSFATMNGNFDYSIQLYKNVKNYTYIDGEALLPSPIKGTANSAGYHTVSLGQEVIIPNGEDFTVVVEITNAYGGAVNFLIDQTYLLGDFEFVNDIENDRSYIGQKWDTPTGNYYFDLGTDYGASARIKAFSSDVAKVDLALENVECSLRGAYAELGERLELTLSGVGGKVDAASIKVTDEAGAAVDYSYNSENGKLVIEELGGNIKISASREIPCYHLTLNGQDKEYHKGDSITANADFYICDKGHAHRFKYWTSSVAELVFDKLNSFLSLIMPDYDFEITAKYNIVGDVNDDESINVSDRFTLRKIIGKTESDEYGFGDIDNDGYVNAKDSFKLRLIIEGKYLPEK